MVERHCSCLFFSSNCLSQCARGSIFVTARSLLLSTASLPCRQPHSRLPCVRFAFVVLLAPTRTPASTPSCPLFICLRCRMPLSSLCLFSFPAKHFHACPGMIYTTTVLHVLSQHLRSDVFLSSKALAIALTFRHLVPQFYVYICKHTYMCECTSARFRTVLGSTCILMLIISINRCWRIGAVGDSGIRVQSSKSTSAPQVRSFASMC